MDTKNADTAVEKVRDALLNLAAKNSRFQEALSPLRDAKTYEYKRSLAAVLPDLEISSLELAAATDRLVQVLAEVAGAERKVH